VPFTTANAAPRRVKAFLAASLDGYIAGPGGDASWRLDDGDAGRRAILAGVDTVLVGRRTYEALLGAAAWPWPDRNVVVFTRNATYAVASPATVAASRPPADVVASLRERAGKDLLVAGGGELVRACLDAGLIDELVVALHPVLLGGEVPLAAPGARRTQLVLVAERRFPSGLVHLAYRVDRDGPPPPAGRRSALTRGSGGRPA
jgi:dihydrofolate reductase